jgi:hypothetical protein
MFFENLGLGSAAGGGGRQNLPLKNRHAEGNQDNRRIGGQETLS